MTYMVCDEDGYALTDGLQEHDAREVAQRMANERGESVWLSRSGSDGMGDEIVPVVNLETDMTSRAEAAAAIKASADLYDLLDALRAFEATVDRDIEDQDHALSDYNINIAELPTFGGEAPASVDGVWSWTTEQLLVGEGSFFSWRVVDRK
jgi:hypothetical protein